MPRSFLITNNRYRGMLDNMIEQEQSDSEYQLLDLSVKGRNREETKLNDAKSTNESKSYALAAGSDKCSPSLSLLRSRIFDTFPRFQDPDEPLSLCVRDLRQLERNVLAVLLQQMQQHQSVLSPPVPPSPSPPPPTTILDPHICEDCGKRYSSASNLARHRQTHRVAEGKTPRQCPHCDKVYLSSPALGMHLRTHGQGCVCHFCGKSFSRPWLLQGHIRTHTGEKPFKCHVCTKAFADKSNLRAHIQTHSSTKPYVCFRCGKAFALKSYLYKHEESSCMKPNRVSHETSKQKFEPKDTDLKMQEVPDLRQETSFTDEGASLSSMELDTSL